MAAESVIATQNCCSDTSIGKQFAFFIRKTSIAKLVERFPGFFFAAGLVQHDETWDLHVRIVGGAAQSE